MSEEKKHPDVNHNAQDGKTGSGDQIEIGSIGSMTGSVVGRGRVQAQTITGSDARTQLFQEIYQRIDQRPEDPTVEKEELASTVKNIEQEVAKGELANPTKVERLISFLGVMAPDILDVTLACLVNPISGVTTVIRKIAEKAKTDAGSANARAQG